RLRTQGTDGALAKFKCAVAVARPVAVRAPRKAMFRRWHGPTLRALGETDCTRAHVATRGGPKSDAGSGRSDPVHDVDGLEDVLRQLLARGGEMLEKRRDDTCRHVRADDLAILVDANLLVGEDVLQLHLVVHAPEHFGDAHALARSVA